MPDPVIDPAIYNELAADQGAQPQLTPEQAMQMQQAQQQPMGQQPPQMTPEQMMAMQMQMQQAQAPAQNPTVPPDGGNPDDQIEQAKQLLGLDQTQQTLQQMQEQLQAMALEKTNAQLQAKYPDVPEDAVKAEIEKMAEIDPNFAESLKNNPAGLEMVYRAAKAASQPKDTPDNLTDDGGAGGAGAGGENLEELVKKGTADDFALGNYILGAKE